VRAAALALVTLAACGRLNFDAANDAGTGDATIDANPVTNPAPGAFSNGARLTAIREGAGTTELFDGWYDTMFGVDCVPFAADDGVTRCLPLTWSIQTSQFADSNCTQQLASADTASVSCGQPRLFAVDLSTHTIHAMTFEHTGTRYVLSSGSCVADNSPAFFTYYEYSGPVVASAFVAAHDELTRNHDLGYHELVYDDGARSLEGDAYDYRVSDTCSVFPVGTDRALCIPDAKAGLADVLYRDATCTQGVAVVSSADANVDVVVLRANDVCGDRFRPFARGAPYAGPTYKLMAAGCTLVTNPDPAFAIGAAVALPTFSRALLPGSGGVQPVHWRSTDGFDLPARNHLWDTARDAWCDPIVLDATTSFVCAPWSTPLALEVYSDINCSSGDPFVASSCVESDGAIYFPSTIAEGTCDGQRRLVREVTSPYASAAAYLQTEHGCEQIDLGTHTLTTWIGSGETSATGLPALDIRR
jgi:hypothetical protein